MNLHTQRITWQPGAVSASTAFNLPSGYQAARYPYAEIHRYDHKHLAFTVTTGAGSVTAPVLATPGDGTALGTAISVGTSAAPGANEAVNTSQLTNLPVLVAATPTYVSATSLKLSVALEAADILVLDIVPVGEAPQYL